MQDSKREVGRENVNPGTLSAQDKIGALLFFLMGVGMVLYSFLGPTFFAGASIAPLLLTVGGLLAGITLLLYFGYMAIQGTKFYRKWQNVSLARRYLAAFFMVVGISLILAAVFLPAWPFFTAFFAATHIFGLSLAGISLSTIFIAGGAVIISATMAAHVIEIYKQQPKSAGLGMPGHGPESPGPSNSDVNNGSAGVEEPQLQVRRSSDAVEDRDDPWAALDQVQRRLQAMVDKRPVVPRTRHYDPHRQQLRERILRQREERQAAGRALLADPPPPQFSLSHASTLSALNRNASSSFKAPTLPALDSAPAPTASLFERLDEKIAKEAEREALRERIKLYEAASQMVDHPEEGPK